MMRIAIHAAVLAAALATGSPGSAGSWGVGVGLGVGVGPSRHYGPPPGYYEGPVMYQEVPPRYQGRVPLVIIGPAPPPAPIAPDAIFDRLEAAGYRELGPMAPRGAVYRLRAVNPEGALVALEVSAHTGIIEREAILAGPPFGSPRTAAAPAAPVGPRARPPQAPPVEGRDPLVVY